jgi:hypothetical protein
MPNLPDDFDFRASAAHMSLLDDFRRPKDVASIAASTWVSHLEARLGERFDQAIERLERAGMLVGCPAADSVANALSADELRRRASEQGLPAGKRTKLQLALSLIAADPRIVAEVTRGRRYLTCTEEGLRTVADFNTLKVKAGRDARQGTYDALVEKRIEDAFEVVSAYLLRFESHNATGDEYRGEWLGRRIHWMLNGYDPPSLSRLDTSLLRRIRAALCMPMLWREELADRWVPQDVAQLAGELKRAMAHLSAAARIAEELERGGEGKVRATFSAGDVGSCDLCKALDRREFEKDTVPRLPLDGCTSPSGCRLHFESVWTGGGQYLVRLGDDDDAEDETYEAAADSPPEETTGRNTAFGKLAELKRMLEHDLITAEDFQSRKAAILDAWMAKKDSQR